MAFGWHRQENNFSRHPKTGALAVALNDKNAGMYVIRFWEWIGTYAPRGQFKRALTEHIERWCEWQNEPGELLREFISAGFVEEVSEETLEAHDWWEHQSTLVEKAEKDAARKRRSRRSNVTRTSAGRHADGHADGRRDGAGTRRDVRDETDVRDVESSAAALSLAGIWNEVITPPLAKVDVARLGKVRSAQLDAAAERRPLPEWRRVFELINASAYCRGSKGWKADIDWATRPEGKKPEPATKVLEGAFTDTPTGPTARDTPTQYTDGYVTLGAE